ncbi:MAG: EAL domain-containing protein [Gallionellaceae bacterium]|jgi:diguanylate cyclase (GGDEF)-like protein/PAS domain S-box-containing protein
MNDNVASADNTFPAPQQATDLRQQAEQIASINAAQSAVRLDTLSLEETKLMLHELQVHQIELEMQNDELCQMQVKLSIAQLRYFDLYDLAPVGYCTVNEAGLMIQANLTLATLLDMPRNTLINKSLFSLILHEDQDIFYLYRKELLESGNPKSSELRMMRPDGTQFWAHLAATLAQDENAPVVRIMLSDITKRKLADAALRASETLNQAILDSVSAEIVVLDRQGTIIAANLPWQRFSLENNIVAGHSVLYAGIGSNYLDACQLGTASTPDQAVNACDGIQSVLNGSIPSFSLEYPCHSPTQQRWFSMSVTPLGIDGQGAVVTHTNITARKLSDERIQKLAHFDQLTGLPNRSSLQERFKFSLSLAQRSQEQLAVIFLDLDHFKDVNDSLGHTMGDELLMNVAKRLKSTLREQDTLSRQGGDEFILVLPNTDANGAALVASKLIDVISSPCQIGAHELITTPSIGIAIFPHDGEDLETLSKNADIAMYRAKQEGRNVFRFFTPQMQAHFARSLQLSNALHHALSRDEMQLHYQPQILIKDGHTIGVEALLRWQHPEFGLVSPSEFIPIAEDNGQIINIGEWVLRTAAAQLRNWLDIGMSPLVMAVNLSAIQFRQANLPELITGILDELKLPHEYLELELTEAVAMSDPQRAVEMIDKLYACGIRMSIDDFGTGYSSLGYLKRFKIYKLKIDQSFVRDITNDPDDKAIVTAIINMASSLGMRTIAEGVETAGQLAFLRLQGCDEVQGYYFSKPLTAEQFEVFMKC